MSEIRITMLQGLLGLCSLITVLYAMYVAFGPSGFALLAIWWVFKLALNAAHEQALDEIRVARNARDAYLSGTPRYRTANTEQRTENHALRTER